MNVSDGVEKCSKKILQWLCTWLTRNIIIIIMYLCICRKCFSIERVLVKCDVTVSHDCFHSHSQDRRHKYLTWRPKCDFLFYFTLQVSPWWHFWFRSWWSFLVVVRARVFIIFCESRRRLQYNIIYLFIDYRIITKIGDFYATYSKYAATDAIYLNILFVLQYFRGKINIDFPHVYVSDWLWTFSRTI